jgi:Xaa-Pro aminopeptidase
MSTINERIVWLREEMKKVGVAAYVIPTSDPHMSEYPAACWKDREWISGFTGSAGTVVVTLNNAGLWTDSRYFLQAADQLQGSGIELFKLKIEGTPSIEEFLKTELKAGDAVGLKGDTFSAAEFMDLSENMSKSGVSVNGDLDLISQIWTDRPSMPDAPVFKLPVEISGKSTEEKISEINKAVAEVGADCVILASLDDVAWTFNLRGTDVSYNPVSISYGFVSPRESVLFINPKKISKEIVDNLRREGVIVADYSVVNRYLSKLPTGTKILVDQNRTNASLLNSINKDAVIVNAISPATSLKSIKNDTEIAGFRNAALKDGVALVKFYLWLEKALAAGEKVTELSASAKLTSLRAEQPLYVMDSFESIAGYGLHGAIVHYSATPESDVELGRDSLFLLDSGAQYLDGTTDITRTISLTDTPSEQMKRDFTLVLKGTIGLADCVFPVGTRGSQVDILARQALWRDGINYLHGTGHGIGHCLNVHEGPQSIRMEENPVMLKPGMVISDEPAMYRAGEYGIRTENMIAVKEYKETDFGKFLCFETLTLCPIDTTLIDVDLLTTAERKWFNDYHRMVFDKLSPLLNEEEKEWLEKKTKEI